jgi:hypothetical protein
MTNRRFLEFSMTSSSAPLGDVARPEGALILQTLNPLDLSLADLEELAAELERVMSSNGLSGVPVKSAGNEPLGVGNQLTDYLIMILPNAEFIKETAFTAVVGAVTVFMRKRFKRKHESRRLRQIDVYGPDGKLLLTYKLTSEDAEPEQSGPDDD